MGNIKTSIDACRMVIDAGDYEKAIEVGKLAVKEYPDNPAAYRCLGEAYFNVGELAYENLKKSRKFNE
jgi:tetratricopeptide (TPR) repeat protein